MKIEDLVGQKYDHAVPREGYSSADLRFAALEGARAAFEKAARYADEHASAAPGEYYVNLEEWLLRMAKELE